MIKADIDMGKLERSLKKFSSFLGETHAQAIMRWSVQVCRELAMETQVWGKIKTKKKQEGKMLSDAYNVLIVVENLTKNKGRGYTAENQGRKYGVPQQMALTGENAINSWIEINRTRRRANTAKLPPQERKVCDVKMFRKVMRKRFRMAGAAKGAWIGAGNIVGSDQKGEQKEAIGRNFLNYTQKHSKWGTARKPKNGWSPSAGITNKLAYSGQNHVLSKTGINRAMQQGLKKTVKFYASIIRKNRKKTE